MELEPAKIFVGLQNDKGLYFYSVQKTLYHISLGDMMKCGWFLKNWIISECPERRNKKFKEEYTFEYYGNFKCPLAVGYLWPYSMVECQRHTCEARNMT